MMKYIYRLKDPRDGEIKYIGQTNNPELRLYQHNHSFGGWRSSLKQDWLHELFVLGLFPEMEIYRTTSDVEADRVELETIQEHINTGCKLVNSVYNKVGKKQIQLEEVQKFLENAPKNIKVNQLYNLYTEWWFTRHNSIPRMSKTEFRKLVLGGK